MNNMPRLQKKQSILPSSKTVKKMILTKKITKRRSYLTRTNMHNQRHGIHVNFYIRFHRNYSDQNKFQRITKPNLERLNLQTQSLCTDSFTGSKFRNLLSSPQRIYFDEKIVNHKGIPTEEIISKFTKSAGKSSLIISNGRIVVRKNFRQKHIAPLVKDLNPIQDVRISDYVFPLDSSLQKDDSRLDICACYNQFKIKKVTKLTYDVKHSFYRATIKERFPSTEEHIGSNLSVINYYLQWLHSLCDHRANSLKERIELYTRNTALGNNYSVEYAIYLKAFGKDSQVNNQKRFYLSKLSNETKNYINGRPATVKCNRLDRRSSEKIQYEVRINQKWATMILLNGIYLHHFDYQSMGLIMQYVRSDNQIELYSQVLFDISSCVIENVPSDKCIDVPSRQLYYRDIYGRKVHGNIKIFRELYIKDNYLNYLSYFVFEQN